MISNNKLRNIDFDYEVFTYDRDGRCNQSLPIGERIKLVSFSGIGDLIFEWKQFSYYYYHGNTNVFRFAMEPLKLQISKYQLERLCEKNTIVSSLELYEKTRTKFPRLFNIIDILNSIPTKRGIDAVTQTDEEPKPKPTVYRVAKPIDYEPIPLNQVMNLTSEIMNYSMIMQAQLEEVKQQEVLINFFLNFK